MSQVVQIGIVDDHQIVIDGLKSLLQHAPHITIQFSTTQSEKVLSLLENLYIDVLLLDIVMPVLDGVTLAQMVKKQYPDLKILMLSMNANWQEVDTLVSKADIAGYALKNITADQLSYAIEKIAKGGIFFSEEILALIANTKRIKEHLTVAQLTQREIEIIKLIEQEHSNKNIAALLFISERTVETHRKNILRKTSTNSTLGLVKYAYEHHLV